MRFASELLERAAVERGARAHNPTRVSAPPGLVEQVRAFWGNQSLLTRFATTFATIVIAAGLILLAIPGTRTSGTYALLTLAISNAERDVGSESKSVQLEPGNAGIRIELTLPDQIPPSKRYRVELVDDKQAARNLKIEQQTDRSLLVVVPANEISSGSYVIRLYAVNPDGTEQRIRGSYYFAVQ